MTPGRNDPCPCGSGRKYKRCCLAKDEAERARQLAGPPAAALTPEPDADADTSTGPGGRRPAADDRWADLFGRLRVVPLDEKVALVRETILATADIEGELAFDLVESVAGPCRDAGRLDDLDGVIDLVERTHPAAFAEEACWFHDWRAENALLRPGDDPMPHLLALARDPGPDIDGFFRLIDWLRYHGRSTELVRVLTTAWPSIRDSDEVMPHAVAEFQETTIDAIVTANVARDASLAATDPSLLADLEPVGDIDPDGLAMLVESRTGRATRAWTPADFARDAEDADGCDHPVHLLSLEFGHALHGLHGWSLPRAEMARWEVVDLIGRCSADDGRDRRRPAKRGAASGAVRRPPTAFLLPAASDVDRRLAGMLQIFGAVPHRAATLFLTLPHWTAFLAGHGLAEAEAGRRMWRDVVGRCGDLPKVIDQFCHDPAPASDVRAALSR